MRRLFVLTILALTAGGVSMSGVRAQTAGKASGNIYYMYDMSPMADPHYEKIVRQAYQYRPHYKPKIPFSQMRTWYAQSSHYDPYGDDLQDRLLELGYTARTESDPDRRAKALEQFHAIVREHLANIDVVVTAMSLSQDDSRLGDPGFYRWVSNGLMETILLPSDGRSLGTSYNILTMGEQTLLLNYLDLEVLGTKLEHAGGLYYNMHDVRNLQTGEEYTLFVNLTLPIAHQEQKRRDKGYSLDLGRQ